jgi:hypothetical protein
MIEKNENYAFGSGKPVKDFSSFCEGDIEPTLNKKIDTIIDCEEDYIIYLDEDLFVQWSYIDPKKTPSGFGSIANRLGHLETISRTQLRNSQYYEFARILAEGMARIIGDEDEKMANELLDKAESYLLIRGTENARIWYVKGSISISFLLFILIFLLGTFRMQIIQYYGVDTFEITFGSLIGGFGALFFLLTRSGKILIDPAAGAYIHYIESFARVLTGCLGALLMDLAIKSNILLGIFKTVDYSFTVLLVISFCAGASERFVSGFIKRVKTN